MTGRSASLVNQALVIRNWLIGAWIPTEVAETIRRFTRGWTVPDLESVSLPALRGAVRNLFAIRLLADTNGDRFEWH